MSSVPFNPTNAEDHVERSSTSGVLRTDSLASGVVLLIIAAIGQRLIGFTRGLLFCRWLSPEELGQWDLAFGFILLAAPLAVLGLPGSFGRYVEHYRQRGQLRTFLRRTLIASGSCAVIGLVALLMARQWFAWFIFESSSDVQLVFITAAALVAVIAYNFLVELFNSLRQMRIVSRMELSNSLLFAGLGLSLTWWRPEAAMVIIAYGGACLLTTLWVLVVLVRIWHELPEATEPLPHSSLWAKLLPFAAWVWVTNLMANLFAVADRYMIIHFSGFDADTAAAMVGNYHSSRIVPALMVSVAGMMSGMLLPYLTEDWERGNREAVGARMSMVLKSFGLLLVAGGVTLLIAAPFLFGVVLSGKYDGGLSVLPWTITYCVWFSLAMIACTYLWCNERAYLTSAVYCSGFVVNILINLWLLPWLGLIGAVLATAAGNAVALVLVLMMNRWLGWKADRGVWLVAILPVVLAFGAVPAAGTLVIVLWVSWRTTWVFSDREREMLQRAIEPVASRILGRARFARFIEKPSL